ncbi:NAD(P)H dehydrogenase (quinone) [Motilibacter rhizosphaerae]|uniref:NAD(P)H dehydrogenase (Quinone) n=1 Tax=Motilibacter rhizosphaerae TaxID=598652 RepID=A0A4Q7NQK8_9ACTN|nr:NAD(P)H-binding protein [Motilibacter rhizosphaerae]RZS87625.1 NAD(P)H dehydrogenase (quinone) [Motilibacter rhizosphaerae]
MTTYAVTGASGPFGRAAVGALLQRVPAADVRALARTTERASDLGVEVRAVDYSQPETLAPALEGVDRLLLVSGSEVGRRTPQHTAVVEAAVAAGVQVVAYTSILGADASPLPLAVEHRESEAVLHASGLPVLLLRNAWYVENYTGRLQEWAGRGEIVSATGEGRVSTAPRAEYAEAAAAALVGAGDESVTYELGGPAFSYAELAAAVARTTGREVRARLVSPEELTRELLAAGLDEGTAGFVAALDAGTAAGALDTSSRDLATLLGREPTPWEDALRAAWQG